MMVYSLRTLVVFALMTMAAVTAPVLALADTVVPSAADATSSWFGPVSPDNLINGVGLSGVGNVLTQTHDNHGGAATMWHAGPNTAGLDDATGNPPVVDDQALVFTLPGVYDLSGAHIWNHSQNNLVARGVDEVEISVAFGTNPLNANFTSVGTYNLTEAAGNGLDLAQAVNFGASYGGVNLVRFDINSTHNGLVSENVGLAEVRFEGLRQGLNRKQLLLWGVETNNEIVETLQVSGGPLFAETARINGTTTGGVGGTAFAWPLSTQLRVYNSLTQLDAAEYGSTLRALSDQLHANYWAPEGGYYCCNGGGDRFYDDNAHLAVALAEAFEITGDQVFLDRAIETFDFLLEGEAPGHNGGSYWSVNDHSFLDSSAALQGARAALMIYKATDDQQYLDHALRRYGWARDTTQLPSGTFLEKLFLTGPQAGQVGNFDLVNFTGQALAANVLFYETTDDPAYLQEAQRIAFASLRRYFDRSTGAIGDEGYWAFELVDGLVELYEADGRERWLDAAVDAMQWLHENKQDPNGHYGVFWGRNGPQTTTLSQWDLNDQAPVAHAFLRLGLADVPGDFDGDGDVDGSDFLLLQRNGAKASDLALWSGNYGGSVDDTIGRRLGAINSVPEPASAALLVGLVLCVGSIRLGKNAIIRNDFLVPRS